MAFPLSQVDWVSIQIPDLGQLINHSEHHLLLFLPGLENIWQHMLIKKTGHRTYMMRYQYQFQKLQALNQLEFDSFADMFHHLKAKPSRERNVHKITSSFILLHGTSWECKEKEI